MENTGSRKLKPEVQQELKKQAIRFRKTDMKQKQIAEILGVYPANSHKWCRAYKKEGAKAIRAPERGLRVGACRNLTIEQGKSIQKAIVDKDSDRHKLPFALRKRIAVQQLTRQPNAIDMSNRTVGGISQAPGICVAKAITPGV